MDEDSSNSVYTLITNLCERFSQDHEIVKKLRTISFELLLGKRINNDSTAFQDVKSPNTFCDVLAWQFTLASKFGLVEHGAALKQCGEQVLETYGESVLKFLMHFRNVPVEEDDFSVETLMDLPETLRKLLQFSVASHEEISPVNEFVERSPSSGIWEIAAKEKYSSRRNWEDFGHPEPDKEKPFLSELGNSSLWVENLTSIYLSNMSQKQEALKPEVKTVAEFVKDVKYLLVGMASYSFSYNETNNFFLIPNIMVDGLTPDVLKTYSKDFLFCGDCYKALYEISVPNPYTGKHKQEGYIFAELCSSIGRYLDFYTPTVINLPEKMGLLKLHERTSQLRNHLTTITAICKLGPYSESEKIPHGVSLLNYLYQTILNLTDKNLLMALYSILFPCCQVYFSRFLQQWLLEGTINDPYEEFFIKPNYKYMQTRGRTYWTRSYSLREDIVPDFLVDLRIDILNSGKTMNLLKSSVQSSKLCSFLMGEKPHIISCCLTSEQLCLLEQNATTFYLQVSAECGPLIKLEEVLRKRREQDPVFMNLIAKKRAATLKRIELERKALIDEEKERKLDEISFLKEQYDLALRQKQARIAREIETELKLVEFNLSVENLRDKLIEKEAQTMIDYYEELYQISENRKKKIDKHIETLKKTDSELVVPAEPSSSDESFYSTDDQLNNVPLEVASDATSLHSSKSLDIINANSENKSELAATTLETFNAARLIKQKVLTKELEILAKPVDNVTIKTVNNSNLTDAQRNKLRVLTSEWGVEPVQQSFKLKRAQTQSSINRNAMMTSNECFFGNYVSPKVDNANYVNKNMPTTVTVNGNENKTRSLSLDFTKLNEQEKAVSPMSVDSTPLSESTAVSKMFLSIERSEIESVPATACTQATDEGFNFDEEPRESQYLPAARLPENLQKPVFSKRVTLEEASGLSTNCLKLLLHESISIPLSTLNKLVNDELIKYFVNDLHYLQHLFSLRDYFFLQDGEFGRNITENLFEKLYDAHFPIELINCRTLQNLVFEALNMSNKDRANSNCVSFKINSLPKRFHLGDPDVLDCLSLTYKVKWPLNILLPADTISKYDEVFKYLIKLNRISWVFKRIFLELKILAKETGKKEIYLMMSPHYRRLHQCRHVMLHFIQTLQNYIVGEVLQPSWESFEKNLANVTNLDSLYAAHTAYIKNILFLCLLNQKSAPLRKIIQKIFVVVLKFYDYLRSRSWKCENGVYVHPNFSKLESIFFNFEEFVLYLFKIGRKVAKSGYQPHLTQLLDMLDINGYYAKNNANVT